jgi:hypothetical protein
MSSGIAEPDASIDQAHGFINHGGFHVGMIAGSSAEKRARSMERVGSAAALGSSPAVATRAFRKPPPEFGAIGLRIGGHCEGGSPDCGGGSGFLDGMPRRVRTRK